MKPISDIYGDISNNYFVKVWAFDESILPLSNSEKSIIFRQFLTHELKKITDNYSLELYYDDNEKPHIKDYTYKSISVSHTKNFLAIQLHKETIAGIDIEFPRAQLLKVQHKFLKDEEINMAQNNLDILCQLWTAKEAIFKIYGHSNISLKQNIRILEIKSSVIIAELFHHQKEEIFQLYTYEHSYNFRITYVLKKIETSA